MYKPTLFCIVCMVFNLLGTTLSQLMLAWFSIQGIEVFKHNDHIGKK